MKRYNEYSKAELAQVSQEDLQTLIDLEFANEGILPEIKPAELPPFDSGIKPTEIFYKVFGVLFKNQADANTVSEMEAVSEDYDYYGAGYNYKYAGPKMCGAVSREVFYSKSDVMRLGLVLAERKKAEELYKEASKKYSEFLETTSNIRNEINDTYREACDFIRKVVYAKQMLEKYRLLADGNERIARNFFLAAYKDSPEITEEVLAEANCE